MNTIVIPPYTLHNFSSMKLQLWSRQQRLILINSVLFALNIVTKDPFFHHLHWYSGGEGGVISLPWKKTCSYRYAIFLILQYVKPKCLACSLFLSFSSGSRWDVLMLILQYCCRDFLSLRVFGLFSSSLLLFPQRFGQYVLWPSSGVC